MNDAGPAHDAGPTGEAGPADEAGVELDAGLAPDAAVEPAILLELGSGDTAFSPARNGDHLPFVEGPQGGHHIWLSVRVRGFSGTQLRMALEVVPALPTQPLRTEVSLSFLPVSPDAGVPAREGTYEFVGWPAMVFSAECAVGKPLRLVVRLDDYLGREVEGALEVVPDAPTLGFRYPCAL